MASQKNPVSVDEKSLQRFTHPAIIPTSTPNEMIQKNSKYFKKNVFLSTFLLSHFFFAEQSFALSVQPLQVKSALGEPFLAQIVITDIVGVDPTTIKASLASDNEFIQFGINKRRQANDLNFKTSITSPERGIITITSDRPLNDPYIEFVVHIGFGNNVRLQQVTALVDPPLPRIQPETLNLPVQHIQLAEASSTPARVIEQTTNPNLVKVTSSVTSRTIPLIPSHRIPPQMSEPAPEIAETPLAKEPPLQDKPLIPSANTPPPMSVTPLENKATEQTIPVPSTPPIVQVTQLPAVALDSAPTPEKPTPEPAPATPEKNIYKVKRNDSLWTIAARIQKENNQPITVIMHSIQQMNKSAFIHGNANHIKSGATLLLPNQQDIQEAPRADIPSAVIESDDVANNKAPILRTSNQQAKSTNTPYIRRGHLPDAKMTLVAPTQEGTTQGSATEKQNEEKVIKIKQLNLRITSARQKNVTLSQEVSEFEAKIKANDQKLALQNARLAELMQRLKNRKDAASQTANRTPKS